MRDKAGPSRPTPTMLALCPCWSLPEAGCMRHLGGWDHWFLGALAMPESLPSSLAIFGSRAKGNLMLSRLRQQRNCSGKWLAQGQWVEARGGRFRLDQPLPKSSPNGAGHMAGEWQCHSGVRREKHGSQSLELSWRETFLAGTERREYRSRAAGGGEAGSPWSAPPSGTCLQVLGPSSARPQAPHVGHCLPLLKPKARVLHGAGRSLRAGPEGYTSRRMWRSRRGACDAALRNLGFRLTQEPSGTGSHSQPGSQLPTAHPGNSLLNREWDRGRGWSWRSWLGPV